MSANEEWLTTGQAAKLLSVSISTVARYVEQGKLRARRLPSGHLRIPRSSVERYLRELGETPEPY